MTRSLRGKRERCVNRRCRSLLFDEGDHVVLTAQSGERVRLCMKCYDMPIREIPEVKNAAALLEVPTVW